MPKSWHSFEIIFIPRILMPATRGLCHLAIDTSAQNHLVSNQTCIFVVVYNLLHVFKIFHFHTFLIHTCIFNLFQFGSPLMELWLKKQACLYCCVCFIFWMINNCVGMPLDVNCKTWVKQNLLLGWTTGLFWLYRFNSGHGL